MMYRILKGTGKKPGIFFAETDANFIAVCNALLNIAYPTLELKGYADIVEPDSPTEGDSYLVLESGAVWGLTVEVYDIISFNGTSWEVQEYNLNEINIAFQVYFFHADNISIYPVTNLSATNVQAAIEELAAAIFGV